MIPITAHSCRRGQHGHCAGTYLILAKTGALVPDIGLDGKPRTAADPKTGRSRVQIVPEMAITHMLGCTCECHGKKL
jgi:hypothetical protein